MATRPHRRPRFEELDPGTPLLVRRGPLAGPDGRAYGLGEEFPYQDLPRRRARALYDQRFLAAPGERHAPGAPPRGGLWVRQRPGTGYFDVIGPDGRVVNEKALRREAADKLAAA